MNGQEARHAATHPTSAHGHRPTPRHVDATPRHDLAHPRQGGPLVGTWPLLRASLRHDFAAMLPWILIVTALSASSALVYPWIFPDPQDRMGLAAMVGSNPALGLIFGPAFDLSTTDGFNAWRSLALGGFLTAMATVFTVTRTTRGQEDSGQAELLASGVVGRGARLLSGVSLALLGSVLLGAVAGLVTVLCGGGWEASLLLGATFTASGWMFAGLAAVTAQLGSDARTASTLAMGVMGSLFLLRGFCYSVDAPDWTVWVNPLGWMTETRPASGDHWWPLLPALCLTVVLLVVAFALQAHRDFGQGAIAQRPGATEGSVCSPWRLAVRLNRASLITWAVAFVGLGVVFGYFATSIRDVLSGDSAVAQVMASGATSPDELISSFIVTILSLVGIIAAIPGVQVMLRVHAEEMQNRVEPLLAGPLRRGSYYAAHVLLAFLATAVYVVLAGLVVAAFASGADIGVGFGETVVQALATIPAVWTVVAVAVAVVGAGTRIPVGLVSWVGVFVSFVLTLLGPTFKLWDWVLAISPFWHIPDVAAANPEVWGLMGISLVTVAFLVLGFLGFRRRDLARQ